LLLLLAFRVVVAGFILLSSFWFCFSLTVISL
jgi:hypothetical protein